MKKRLNIFLCMLLLLTSLFTGCQSTLGQSFIEQDNTQIQNIAVEEQTEAGTQAESELAEEIEIQTEMSETVLEEEGSYTSKEDVAAYLHQYGKLPSNFITKKEAKKLGWVNTEGNLGEAAPGKSIGGDYFGNNEGLLPEADGRDYYECDINTDGSYRGAERIVFSNDGLIYYTSDHYKSFELLYGEE